LKLFNARVPHRFFTAVKEAAKKLDMDNIKDEKMFEENGNKLDLLKL
jgi:hypothetical protein